MATKSKGSKGSDGLRPGGDSKPENVTLKITVPREVARLIRLQAFGLDCSLGQVVAEWSRLAPRRFILQDRGRASVGAEGTPPPTPSETPGLHQATRPLGIASQDVA
jgi:hypothetical protein